MRNVRLLRGVVAGSAALLAFSALQAETKSYSYDALGRLFVVQEVKSSQGQVSEYHYDKAGNRTIVWSKAARVGGLAPRTLITVGELIVSPDASYALFFHLDGNVVLYDKQRQAVWMTNSSGSGAAQLVMQNDGNLVLYNASAQPVWATNTFGYNNYFSVQSDGNLVVYSTSGTPLWAIWGL